MFYNLFDPYYWILIVPSLLLALWAQMMVSSNFKKYSQVYNRRGYTGADAARMILDSNGLYHVRIERVSGNLTDHYDPKAEVIRLSDSVYGSASVAAVGVAAHEAGHAVQHATGYLPIKIRSAIIPVTQIGSQLSIPLILLGFLFQLKPLVFVGILFYATAALFQLVTLPVEFNASSRAMKVLEQSEMLAGDELAGAG
ncbi:MAG: zinc metallopeptidase, partial [Oscillospiraceae bacterium]|nr:zinc metallopeptidase [Oscillospiraceae bacterium]